MSEHNDVFGARAQLSGAFGNVTYYRLASLAERGITGMEKLPYTVRIILENALRHAGGGIVSEEDVLALARWTPGQAAKASSEFAFFPGRVLMQDFTGVPAVADLAAMRNAMARLGGDPSKV